MTTLHSGGAIGADWAWAKAASSLGVDVVIHSFLGHKPEVPSPAAVGLKVTVLTPDQLDLSVHDVFCAQAASALGRPWRWLSPYVKNLQRRNVDIIQCSSHILAVGRSVSTTPHVVDGGTGWGIALAQILDIPYSFFDQTKGEWMGHPLSSALGVENIAGIGSRNLTPAGNSAIQEVATYLWSKS